MNNKDHILITALGVQAQLTSYALKNETADANFAPIALLKLLPVNVRPSKVLIMLTQGAQEKTWKTFQVQFNNEFSGIELTHVFIPDGKNEDEIKNILEHISPCIPNDCDISLDISHGYRHFPFISYALVLYLKALRNINVRGAYYGMIETKTIENGAKPIIDLKMLLDFPEWFYAVQLFNQSGIAIQICQLLEDESKKIPKDNANDGMSYKQSGYLKTLAVKLTSFSSSYEFALPLEMGEDTFTLNQKITQNLEGTFSIPFFKDLLNLIRQPLLDISLDRGRKPVVLDKSELNRQSIIIDMYLAKKQFERAVGLMREWVVSLTIFYLGKKEYWLKSKERKNAEYLLGALSECTKDSPIKFGASEKTWGLFWQNLGSVRNFYHHHGMREEGFSNKSLDKVVEFWVEIKNASAGPPNFAGGAGRLLISPQGKTPGVLYSALLNAKPTRCLIICSEQSRNSVTDAARQADFTGPIEYCVLTKPFDGYEEFKGLLNKFLPQLIHSDQVIANLTGGTTLMGILAQQFIEKAQRFCRPTRRFMLLDQRNIQEQEQTPFLKSECKWLDDGE